MYLHRAVPILAVVLAASPIFCGQRITFGGVAGSALTRDFPTYRTVYEDAFLPGGFTTFDLFSDTRSPIAGVSVDVNLCNSFSVEADALHRNLTLSRRYITPEGAVIGRGSDAGSTWEWPILLKYRFPSLGRMRPFIEAGSSFRTRKSLAGTEPSQFGRTVGAGLEIRSGRFRFSPAIRYTRWQYDGGYPRFAAKRDQVELLAGIGYVSGAPSFRLGGRRLRFGVVAGAPLTGAVAVPDSLTGVDELQGYTAGLLAEIELSRRLSVELSGLYRPFRANWITYNSEYGEGRFEFTVLTWQFPVLARYRLREEGKARPVIEAGPSFRFAGNTNGYAPSHAGFSVGAGVETLYKGVTLSPVLRYTRWAPDSRPKTAPNQVEALLSFKF